MRRIAIVLATLTAATFGGLAIAAPAQAAPKAEQYVAITSYGDQLRGWFWIDQLEGIIGCPKCVHWFDFGASRVLTVDQEKAVKGGIMAGLGQLSEASVTTDPRTRDRLRVDALAQFTSAARALGGLGLRSGPVGYYDPDNRTTVAADTPWLAAADKDIVNGIQALQRSFAEPEPEPWITTSAAAFDKAFAEISSKQVAKG